MPIGMRKAPIRASSASRERRIAGMVTKTLRRMGPRRARGLVLGVGLVVLLVVAIVMYARRVDPVEVAGTLLFIPIFIAFVIWDFRGGLIAAVLAAAAYALLRYP